MLNLNTNKNLVINKTNYLKTMLLHSMLVHLGFNSQNDLLLLQEYVLLRCDGKKRSMGFLTRSNKNQPVQSQKQVRGLKFWLQVEEKYTIRVAKTKTLISFTITAKLICKLIFNFVSAQTKIWFSHDVALFRVQSVGLIAMSNFVKII